MGVCACVATSLVGHPKQSFRIVITRLGSDAGAKDVWGPALESQASTEGAGIGLGITFSPFRSIEHDPDHKIG
jgi:hypothetical protein